MKKKYYVGLDIGTDSVGWAVTDENYQLLENKGKPMWGARLFDEAKTAEERRVFRSGRRRLERKKQRIRLLEEEFAKEIYKVDPNFFIRLENSNLFVEDKDEKVQTSNCLFDDTNYTDQDYHTEFPTIYHLRKALIENKKQYDVRLVFLALHNIFKHRGHFLYEGSNMESISSFENVYSDLVSYLDDNYDIKFQSCSAASFEAIIKNKSLSATKKKDELCKLCSVDKSKKDERSILGLISGTTEKLAEIFNDEQLKESEKSSICFGAGTYDEDRILLDGILSERCLLIDKLKAIYDWSILAEILEGGDLNGKQYLSVSKCVSYEKHKDDLKLLKSVIKEFAPEHYNNIFKTVDDKLKNYVAYIGMNKSNSSSKKYVKHCSRDDFYKYIGSILDKLEKTETVEYLLAEKNAGTLLPLQVNGDNGVIPYQVHKMELVEILENASEYLTFFNVVEEESKLTVKEKLIKIFEFRVPYYVGPLNTAFKEAGENCWMVRKEEGIIRPWNFKDKVDLDASAQEFILRMTNECTYLTGEKVLPKNSLLYSEFMVLNELNNVKIDNEKLSDKLKQEIFEGVYCRYKKVTISKLCSFLHNNGYEVEKDKITGIDIDFKCGLNAYHDFKDKIGIDMTSFENKQMVEEIIFWITVYSDGGKILKHQIERKYANKLSDEQISKICRLKYSGWGNLSRAFLEDIKGANVETGECMSIIGAMRSTNNNMMQLLSNNFTYVEAIRQHNDLLKVDISKISYEELVKDLYVSPSVKRSIWQTVLITEEIKQILKSEPEKIFVEMARGPEKDKKRTSSRKSQLLELYKKIKDEERNWIGEIEGMDEDEFRSQNIFLYYTQMGKDMYTGKNIDFADIINGKHVYDRDHIYPQSKTKDDSILNNLVLVNKNDNKEKSDGVVPLRIQQKMKPFWMMLKARGLITDEKYNRLLRTEKLSNDELAGFISRQVVETRQSTKAVATLLGNIYSDTEVVYVKAQAVSDFKRDYADVVKVREINDYHHAKDAYLNVVVGNVYNSMFTSNPYMWMKNNKNSVYSLNRMFDRDFEKNNKIIWKRGNEGTIKTVKQMVEGNKILFTKYAYCEHGAMFNQQILKAGKGKVAVKGNASADLSKYGGYSSVKSAYFILVESDGKDGRKKTIEIVPLYLAGKFETDKSFAINYCEKELALSNPVILIPKIKKKAKFIINGFPVHIAGHSGNYVEYHVAAQLVVDKKYEKYLKKISKYLEKNKERNDKHSLLSVCEYDKITAVENIETYDMLSKKHKDTIYAKRAAGCIKTLESGREQFVELSVEEQCVVIGEILHIFQCKSIVANLSLIGGVNSVRRVRYTKEITSLKSAKLVYQSPTGLYEQVIDLLKL